MRLKGFINRLVCAAALGVISISLPACGEWIYDEDDGTLGIGDTSFSMVDASKYTDWAYIDLAGRTATVVDEYSEGTDGTPPASWHFAMHRFDCKTNGAQVLETEFSEISELVSYGEFPEGEFIADIATDDKIAYDMSGMMEGIILYAESNYNTEFSRWMNVDLSGMPPTYTPSGKVYLLRFADDTMAAVRFTDFVGPSEVKGFNSFDYLYPVVF